MRIHVFVLAVTVLASPLFSQKNAITNGDFEKGMTGWTTSGEGGWPSVVSADLMGLGKSKAFSVYPGAKRFNPNNPPYVLKQKITIIPKVEYEFTADVMSLAQSNNQRGGSVEVKIGGVSVFKWGRFSGAIKKGTYREKIAGRFTQQKVGKVDIEIQIQRRLFTYTKNMTPRLFIDNIKLAMAPRPSVFIVGDRKIGGTLDLQAIGTPKGFVGVFIAPKLLTRGIPVFGFRGKWELNFGFVVYLLAGALDSKTGRFQAKLPIPNNKNLLGNPLYWQGFEISPNPSLGPTHNFNLTQ